MVEDFSLRLQMLISKMKSHGVTIDEEETMLDLSTLTIEDVTGHLWEVDEHLEQVAATKDSGKLLLTEEEWAARRNFGKAASSSRGGDGKHRDKASLEKKKQVDPCRCFEQTPASKFIIVAR